MGKETGYPTRFFATEAEARAFMRESAEENLIFGGLDPTVPCVPLDRLPWAHLVYSSDPRPMVRERAATAVKVFEIRP